MPVSESLGGTCWSDSSVVLGLAVSASTWLTLGVSWATLVRSTLLVPISRSVRCLFIFAVSWTCGVKLLIIREGKRVYHVKMIQVVRSGRRMLPSSKLPEPRVRLMCVLSQGSGNEASQTSMQRRVVQPH